MGGCATIGVHDDLAAGQPGIAIRAANHERARRVHPPLGVVRQPSRRQHIPDIGLHDCPDIVRGLAGVMVLRGQHNRCHLDRLSIFVAQGQLTFGIRTKAWLCARFPRISELLEDLMRIEDRGWHAFRRFIGGVAEHDALIASSIPVNALGDMGRLRV